MMRNLLRQHAAQFVKSVPPALEQADLLEAEHLQPLAVGHAGLPEATDSLAYDPVQHLLALGTSDGRVKVVGREGVEASIVSPSPAGTKHLQFLPGHGALLRVNLDGDLQLFGLEEAGILDNMPLDDDHVTAVAVLEAEPYVLLGCASGALRVAALLRDGGGVAEGVARINSMDMLPYTVSPEQLHGEGAIVSISAHEGGSSPRETVLLVVVHEDSGAAVWDARRQKVLAVVANTAPEGQGTGLEPDAGRITCACWVGDAGRAFATGHERGAVRLWSVPPEPKESVAEEDEPPPPPAALLRHTLHMTPAGADAEPLRALAFVSGQPLPSGEALLAFGGQPTDKPDTLTLLPLTPSEDGESGAQPLPWFGTIDGYAAVPPPGSLGVQEDPAAIIVLTEGGQLMVHDLKTGAPVPLSLPFQELSPVSVSALCGSAVDQELDGCFAPSSRMHAVTLDSLRAVRAGAEQSPAWKWRYILSGGSPPVDQALTAGAGDILVTGHRDGRVRLWDACAEVPRHLATAPFDSGGQTGRLRTVTALQACTASGLLAVGHQQGDVRLFQFSSRGHDVCQASFMAGALPTFSTVPQPPGWQCLLHAALLDGDVISLALASRPRLLAAGDAKGRVVVLDLAKPVGLWAHDLGAGPVAALALGMLAVPANPRRSFPGSSGGAGGDTRVALFAANAEAAVAVFDAHTGEGLGSPKPSWVAPKNASAALGMALLDDAGGPVAAGRSNLSGPAHLPWAGNAEAPPTDIAAAHLPPTPEHTTGSFSIPRASPMAAGGSPLPPWVPPPPKLTTIHSAAGSDSAAGGGYAAGCGTLSPGSGAQSPAGTRSLPGSPAASAAGSLGPQQQSPAAEAPLSHLNPALNASGASHRSETGSAPSGGGGGGSLAAESPTARFSPGGAAGASSDSEASSRAVSSDDDDDLLAAAVAAMEAKDKKPRRQKPFIRRKGRSAKNDQAAAELDVQHSAAASPATSSRQLPGTSTGKPPRPLQRTGSGEALGRRASGGGLRQHHSDAGSVTSDMIDDVLDRGGTGATAAPSPIATGSPATATWEDDASRAAAQQEAAARQQEAAAAAMAADQATAQQQQALPPAFVLLATQQYLRLYSPEGLRQGDRTTLRRAQLAEPLVHAAAFSTPDGPGVACLTHTGNLLVYSLPGLEPLLAAPLQRTLGFPFCAALGGGAAPLKVNPSEAGIKAPRPSWNDGATVALQGVFTAAVDGHHLLISHSGETVRFTLAAGSQVPNKASSMYDWDVATAAAAAARQARAAAAAAAARAAPRRADSDREAAPVPGLNKAMQARLDAMAAASSPGSPTQQHSAPRASTSRTSLSVFLNSVKDVTTKVITETEKGVREGVTGVVGLARTIEAGFRDSRGPPPPTLAQVFEGRIPSPAELEEQYEDTSPTAASGLEHQASPTAGNPYGQGAAGSSSPYAAADPQRAELFRGARRDVKPDGKPAARSAAEIRAAYGRPAQSRVHSQAAQNREALQQRGEKLSRLNERTEQMEADAMDFASMARQIAQRERDRKWWQV